jgi:hypothetical protein
MNVYSKWKPGKMGEILWQTDQDKNSKATFNHLIKLVLNFDFRFSMKFEIIYIYILLYIIYMYVYIYIYLTKDKNELCFF